MARFQREAEVLASLNDPHIAQSYRLEIAGDVTALVMELVEGPTLAERIAQGPLPLDEVMLIARQIAEALEAAHARGIIHRDLKPANVKVRLDNLVKVLDFGLAKAMTSGVRGVADGSESPTALAMSHSGIILGTAAYMAPEQARGRELDQRADIWAFGCVLYEMLTARRAFEGDTVTDTLAAVMLREPDWTAWPGTPEGLRRLVVRCLRKDPKQRLHSIADVRIELEDTAPLAPIAPIQPHSPSRRRLVWSIAAGLVLVAFSSLQTLRLFNRDGESRSSGVVRFTLPPPAGVAFDDNAGYPLVTLSPNGGRVALVYGDGTRTRLFTRRLDENDTTLAADAEHVATPFFSPDGRWIGFADGGGMKKVAVDGNASASIVQNGITLTGAVWTPDGTIIYTPSYNSGLWAMPAAGGMPRQLTVPDAKDGELGHQWPELLPDGKTILFTTYRAPADRSRIELYSLATGMRTRVVDGGFRAHYVRSGYIVFARSTTVFAMAFDLERAATVGQPVPVLSGVAVKLQDGMSQFSVSESGTLAYIAQEALTPPRQLAWLSRDGRIAPLGVAARRFDRPSVSPDGRRVAMTIRDKETGDSDVWIYDLARATFGRFTTTSGAQSFPVWSADGRRLFFTSEEPVFNIFERPVEGIGDRVPVVVDPFDVISESVSPDGHFLVYSGGDVATGGGLFVKPLSGGMSARVFRDTAAQETDARISPDGHWLAYTSDEAGRNEIYIQAFPEGSARVQVSSNGGSRARWSRDGTELFYLEDEKMMVARIRNGDVGPSTALFTNKAVIQYDVAPDGRFLAVLRDQSALPAPVNIVLNWTDELKRLTSAQ